MKFEVGKEYTTRGGSKVRCVATDCKRQDLPILMLNLLDGTIFYLPDNGKYYINIDSNYDILPKTKKLTGWMLVEDEKTRSGCDTVPTNFEVASRFGFKYEKDVPKCSDCKVAKVTIEVEED